MGAPEFGLAVTGGPLNLAFGRLIAGANNDCPDASAPRGIVSLTIGGVESGGAGFVTLCVSRPDRLATTELALGASAAAGVRVVDLTASVAGCSYSLDASQPPSGTVRSLGMCADGTDPRGFVLIVDANARFSRTCGTSADTVDVQLQGQVAVAGT